MWVEREREHKAGSKICTHGGHARFGCGEEETRLARTDNNKPPFPCLESVAAENEV